MNWILHGLASFAGQTIGSLADPLIWIGSYVAVRIARGILARFTVLAIVFVVSLCLRYVLAAVDPIVQAADAPARTLELSPGIAGAIFVSFGIIILFRRWKERRAGRAIIESS
jgi:hypothetical protein